jgi:hypothetical protein
MTYRPSRLVVSIPTASSDGLFYGRYPSGNAPLPAHLAGAATDAVSASANLSIAVRFQGAATDTTFATATLTGTLVLPSAVTNVLLTNQGGTANNASVNAASLTNQQAISWSAASAGTYVIDHYRIYRNGVAYDVTPDAATFAYVDAAATNSNDVLPNDFSGTHFNAPRTIYDYNVAAVDNQGNVGPQAAQFSYFEYKSGVDQWGHTAFNPSTSTINYASTAVAHAGSTSVMQVTATNTTQGEYIQPSSGAPGVPLWSFESGAFANGYMQMDVYPTAAGQQFQIGIISRVTPGDFYNNAGVIIGANAAYGPSPMVQNAWNHYTIPMAGGASGAAGLMMGTFAVTGYIAGALLTVTSMNGTTNTIQPTDWISGNGMTPDYVLGPGPSDNAGSGANGAGGTGTYDMSISQTIGSSGSPVTFNVQRTNVYKWAMSYPGGTGTIWYLDNIAFTRTNAAPGA